MFCDTRDVGGVSNDDSGGYSAVFASDCEYADMLWRSEARAEWRGDRPVGGRWCASGPASDVLG